MQQIPIPQTTIPRIQAVVRAVHAGARTQQEVEKATRFPERQVRYALLGAKAIGLVRDQDGDWQVTNTGEALASAVRGTEEERAATRRAIETSPMIRRLAPGLLANRPPTREDLAIEIRKLATDMGPGTALHRAGMILAWRKALLPRPAAQTTLDLMTNQKRSDKATPRPTGQSLLWFAVENYKSIKSIRVDFRPFMVLVGPNGAGKTNILQALALFLDMLAAGSTEPVELYGGYDQLVRRARRRGRFIRFALCCHIDPMPLAKSTEAVVMEATVVIRSRSDAEGVQVESEELRLWTNEGTLVDVGWKGGRLVNLEGVETFRNRLSQTEIAVGDGNLLQIAWTLRSLGYRRPSTATRLRLDASALRSDALLQASRQGRLLGLTGEGLPLAVERLRKSPVWSRIRAGLQEVYPRIEDVDTIHLLPGQVALRFKERLIEEGLGQANVSDGVMHALALLIALEGTPAGGILEIEEPENALHPWALRKLIGRAQELSRSTPLLMSTHSPTLVDAVQDPAALYIVENHDQHGSVITPAVQKERALQTILAESGQKLGEIWLGGGLGGVPEEHGG